MKCGLTGLNVLECLSFYRVSLFFLFFSFALLISFDRSFSQTISAGKVPVDITAEKMTYDKEEDKYLAEGDVVLIKGGIEIKAEVLTLEGKSNIATAMGDVIVTDVEGNIVRGELLVIDLDKNIGEMNKGKLFFKSGNFHVEGEKITKTGEKTYEIEEGSFTTCNCQTPDWSFSGSDVKITDGEFLVSKKNFFYIKGIPVLYSPYAVLPVNRKRQTGFLRPKIGFSDLRGTELDNTFFWAIAENRDATFYLDYMDRRGLGKGLEYRYITKRGSSGEIFFYHFKEKDIDRVREFRTEEDNAGHPQDAGDNRWLLTYVHDDTLPKDITVRVDINEVSDDEYFLDFAKDSEERALQKLESNVAISKQWNQYNLVTQFRYFDDLLVEGDENTLQRLPEMTFRSTSQPLFGTPVYISSDSSYNYFYRSEGVKGHRTDFHPKFSLPFNPGGYFELTPQVGLRETVYWTNENDKFDNRNLYDLSLSMQTTFLKVFDMENDKKIKHSIRPNVTYSYIPDLDQTGLPNFDDKDLVSKENKVTYSLTSFLTHKWFEKEDTPPSYRDTIFLEISQSFDINEARSNSTTPEDEKRPFSDLKAELILAPDDRVYFKGKGEYNVYTNQTSNYELSLNLNDRRGDKLDVNYNYDRNVANYLELDANVNVLDGLNFFHNSRFSFLNDESKTLETTYGIDYQRQCWGIRLSKVEKLDENIYFATINLLGFGDIGSVSASVDKGEDDR